MNETYGKILDSFLTIFEACPIPIAIKRNGMASPSEKTESRSAPWVTVAVEVARNNIDARIGPTQGVHPNAKVAPKINELDGVPGLSDFVKPNRFSVARN